MTGVENNEGAFDYSTIGRAKKRESPFKDISLSSVDSGERRSREEEEEMFVSERSKANSMGIRLSLFCYT